MCAVGSPSVTMMICLLPPFCRPSSRRASWKPACMLVPKLHSLEGGAGSCSARDSRRAQLARVEREAHDVELVARKLAADQRVEREGDLLGGKEAAVKDH